MLLAITNTGKLGLGVLAGLFILFAALSSFYFPRRNPSFPGNRLGLFVAVAGVLFVATIVGVVVFASEGEERHEAGTEQVEGGGESEPATTGGESTPAEPAGDAAAGEQVFASAGCGGCHTLEAAGSSGNVGPNLDQAQPDLALVENRVHNGQGVMPSFEGQLSEKQIDDVAAFVVASTSG